MKIEMHDVTIRELVDGYRDEGDDGVFGYGGRLDIRPPYQREFVYDETKRMAVIDSIMNGFPLNVMYWVARADGGFEVMDGQQRTVSIGQFFSGDFSYDMRYFHNFEPEERARFHGYRLKVYFCSGTDAEKIRWFERIEVGNKKGIIPYLLTGEEKHLHLRGFSDAQRLKMYERQGGLCPLCGRKFALEEMHADHVRPWCRGGQTTLENGQMLCHDCNWTKGKR